MSILWGGVENCPFPLTKAVAVKQGWRYRAACDSYGADNKRNHTMTTVRHVSQCSSLRYSLSFSHKCPRLVGASSRLQSDAICENAHHHAAYSSICTVGSYHRRPLRDANSSRRIWRVRRVPKQSLRSVPTNILETSQHRNGVSAAAAAPGTDAAADALAVHSQRDQMTVTTVTVLKGWSDGRCQTQH